MECRRVCHVNGAAGHCRLVEGIPLLQLGEDVNLNGGLRTGFTANTIMRDPSWRKGRAIHASLYMSEADAAALEAKEGELMRITSKRASITAPLKIDKNTLAGHLHLPNILGQNYPDLVTGELKPTGVSINELVDAMDRDPYTACPHTKRIRCKVERVADIAA